MIVPALPSLGLILKRLWKSNAKMKVLMTSWWSHNYQISVELAKNTEVKYNKG